MLEAEVEDGGFGLGADPVGMGSAWPALLLDEPGDA
jgi:hypothetical protein